MRCWHRKILSAWDPLIVIFFCRVVLVTAVICLSGCQDSVDWRARLSPELRSIERELVQADELLSHWQPKQIGPTSPPLGVQHRMVTVLPDDPPVIEISVGKAVPVDTIVLVPAWLNFGLPTASGYGFPVALDVETTGSDRWDDPVAWHRGEVPDPALRHGFPMVLRRTAEPVQTIRITVTWLPEVAEHWTFAMAEVFALSNGVNVAVKATCRMDESIRLPPFGPTNI